VKYLDENDKLKQISVTTVIATITLSYDNSQIHVTVNFTTLGVTNPTLIHSCAASAWHRNVFLYHFNQLTLD